MQDQCHSRSRLSNVNVIEGQAIQGQGHFKFKVSQSNSRSRSSHGHSHFEVKVILESMVIGFDFYPKAGSWLSSECLLLLVYH